MRKYIVLKEFADKNNIGKRYLPGEILPDTFDEERLTKIVERGLARVEDSDVNVVKDKDSEAKDIDLESKMVDLLTMVKVCTDVEKLREYLNAEKVSEKPRETLVKAIEERLTKIVKE